MHARPDRFGAKMRLAFRFHSESRASSTLYNTGGGLTTQQYELAVEGDGGEEPGWMRCLLGCYSVFVAIGRMQIMSSEGFRRAVG